MHLPTGRIAHTTAFATLVVEHWLERENEPYEIFREGSHRMNFIKRLPGNRTVSRDFNSTLTPYALHYTKSNPYGDRTSICDNILYAIHQPISDP